MESKLTDNQDDPKNSSVKLLNPLTLSEKRIEEFSITTNDKPDLSRFQCPYTWEECTVNLNGINWVHRLQSKILNSESNDWSICYNSVLLGYIYSHKNEEEKALETFELCEKHLSKVAKETFFKDILEGIQHVIAASKCHLYHKTGKFERANYVATTIKPFKDLSKPSQAVIWATKAYIILTVVFNGKEKALECAKMAIELDPDNDGTRNGTWYYIAGSILSKMRRGRSYNELPSKEELQLLERSTKINPSPLHLVTLADSYREAAKVLFKTFHENNEISVKLCQAALDMYRMAVRDENANVEVLRRCGSGLLRLPKTWRDVKLAEEALKMALKMSPENPFILLALGDNEEWSKNDHAAALYYYDKSYSCGSEVAAVVATKIRYKINQAYNPVDDCNKYISDFHNSRRSITCQNIIVNFMVMKGEYYLFLKNDLLAAAHEWEEAIKTAPDSSHLLEYRRSFCGTPSELNIYDVLKGEIGTALRLQKYSGEDEIYLKRLLMEITEGQHNSCEENGANMEGSVGKDARRNSNDENDEPIDNALKLMGQLNLSGINKNSTSTADKCNLDELECPYTWKECSEKFDEIDWEERILLKLSRPNCNDWRIYSFKVLLGCIYGHKKEEEKALETFEWCEKYLNEKAEETFFKDIIDGMQHVVAASKCHFYIKSEKSEKADEVASTIKPLKDLSRQSQAATWATKAYICTEFDYDGKVKALECAKMAVELDPDDDGTRRGAWYYLTGKILGQIRRIMSYNELPSKEELTMLERAVKKDPFSVHFVILADSYREAAKVHFKSSRRPSGMSDKLCRAAQDMYKKAINNMDFNVGILRRCGSGLMKLPKRYRDLKLAEEALKMAVQMVPENPAVLLALGNLENWHKNNPSAALNYYEKSFNCGSEFAAASMIKIRYKLIQDYNPVEDCDKAISKLQTVLQTKMSLNRTGIFMVIKGEYYLSVKNDLLAAAREWEEAIKIAPDSSCVLEHNCVFSDMRDGVNIYLVLQKEIMEAVRLKNYDEEDEKYLIGLLELCEQQMP